MNIQGASFYPKYVNVENIFTVFGISENLNYTFSEMLSEIHLTDDRQETFCTVYILCVGSVHVSRIR